MSQVLDMWSALLLVSVCGLVHGQSRLDPLVSTKTGLIRGLISENGYSEFLGVPYAVVDKDNPFGQSKPHPGFDDIFEAYESNACPQVYNDVAIGTIDCLTMNIHVPNIANSRNRLPVLIWIHGGAFVEGSSNHDGSPNFLVKNGIIVVAINYRLNVYGFMCLDHPEVPGNQGLKDQVLALRWIKENIDAFGGDATQITVFGESAGGMSVNYHLLSSYEKLFQRAIIQSGPAISTWASVRTDHSVPLRLAEALDFNSEDITEALEYLSSVDVLTLVRIAHDIKITSSVGIDQPLTKPCVEKEFEGVENFITENLMNIESTKVITTPIIIGNNNNELSFQLGNADAELFANYNFEILGTTFDFKDNYESVLDDIIHFYVGDEKTSEDVKQEITDFASDFLFNHPTQRMAERFIELGAKTVYRYIFSYDGGRNGLKVALNLTTPGAAHADELGYLFDLEFLRGEMNPEDQLMVDRMTTLWTNFAKCGNPTPETSDLLPVKWEPITETTQPYLSLDSELALESRPFYDRMAFWDVFYKLYRNQETLNYGNRKNKIRNNNF